MVLGRGMALLVVLASSLTTWGCHAPPVIVDSRDSSDAIERRLLEEAIWGLPEKTPSDATGARAAVMECTVEFITMKQVTPSARQAMLGGAFTPLTAIVELSGVFRRRVTYPSETQLELALRVYDALVARLLARGYDVIEADRVVASRTLRNLDGSAVDFSSLVYHLNMIGGDTGRIGEFRAVPAHPLPALHDEEDDTLEFAERALLAEFDADLVIRLRLRVGLYKGRVSIEQGSSIHIACGSEDPPVESVRSVVSEAFVGGHDDLMPVAGERYSVDWELFMAEAIPLSAAYVRAGLGVALGAGADAPISGSGSAGRGGVAAMTPGD